MRELSPVVNALKRHRLMVGVIVLEVTLACAVLCNALAVVIDRTARTDIVTGMVEPGLSVIEVGTDNASAHAAARTRADLIAISQVPGVKSVIALNQMPLTQSEMAMSLGVRPDQVEPSAEVSVYMASPGVVSALGLRLVSGRDFMPDEHAAVDVYLPRSPVVVVSRVLAERLFGGESAAALGKTVYLADRSFIIVGVVDHLLRSNVVGATTSENSILVPALPGLLVGSMYAIRVLPGSEEGTLRRAADAISSVDAAQVIVQSRPFADIRQAFFARDTAMARILVGVGASLLLVTALGLVGLTGFWVQRRRHAIGIRRALGATRGDVIRYFHLENAIVVGVGAVLGVACAFALNQALMHGHEMARLSLSSAAWAALVFVALGQLSVIAPALRAANVPPVAASRIR